MIASGLFVRSAIARAAIGSSHAPGTRTTSDVIRIGAVLLQRIERAGEQRIRNETVEAADHDREPEPGGAQFAVEALVSVLRSFACKYRFSLFEKSAGSFAPVFRCGGQPERHRFESQARLQAAVEPAIDRFHRQCYSQRPFAVTFAAHCFAVRDQFVLRRDRVDQPDAIRFRRIDRFARKQQFERPAAPDQPRQTLRRAITGHDAELDFRLPELRIGRCDANRTAHRQFQSAARARIR